MNIKIYPSKVSGSIKIPPSKSMAHRAIICASLSDGISKISNVDFSEDILTTIEGMQKLGAKIEISKNSLIIKGITGFKKIEDNIINCNESGSSLRFFIPIFSMLDQEIIFLGKNRLMDRPQEIYKEIFLNQNLKFIQEDKKIKINGKLKPNIYEIKGDISSQFISGLMFILPILNKDSIIKIIPPFESISYVKLTIDMLKKFGIDIIFLDEYRIKIKGNQKYKPTNYSIEGDYSQLGFFAVLGAINNDITCLNLDIKSNQGDKQIIDILKDAGVKIDILENGYKFYKSKLNSIEVDLKNCPDLGPILMVLGCFIENFKITNAGRLRYKESDRIMAMEMELKKLGVEISSTENEIFIYGKKDFKINNLLYSHKDHRIAMSLSILATVLEKEIIISEAECINKSYPNFYEDLEKLGVKIEKIK